MRSARLGRVTGHPSAKVLLIIPAWNEEHALPLVLAEVSAELPDMDVVVVNDGSTDATAAVVRARGIKVIDLPINLGVGGAMRAGFLYAERAGYDVAIQLDADGQHDPQQVPELVKALDELGADVVIGARFAGRGEYSVRGPRKWAMRMLSSVLSRVTGTRLTDSTSGFKAINRRAILLYAKNYPAEYLGDTIEALVIGARSGLVIRQVPVSMRERVAGQPSHNPWKAMLFLGRACAALLLALSRPAVKSSQEVAG